MNINKIVSVVLTEFGVQHLKREGRWPDDYQAGDRITMTMWELIAWFGSAFPRHPSTLHQPFRDNDIQLEEDAS